MLRISTLLEKEPIALAFQTCSTAPSAEELFAQTFLSQLPRSEYVILNNILLRNGEHTTQIDNIVISRFGIFVIEAKEHRGNVWGLGYLPRWRTYYEYAEGQKYYEYQNPLLQNYCHTSALKEILPKEIHNTFVSIISFTNSAYVYFKGSLRERNHIVVSEELSNVILSHHEPVLSKEEVQIIVQTIVKENIQSPENITKHIASTRMRYPNASQPIQA